jgi:heme A synthase
MTWFQRLLLITIFATFVLVVIGGTVRATDSGLGCPDWPMCHGEIIPPAEKHTLIEFSHRTAAFIVGCLFLGVTYFTFKTERRDGVVFWLAFTAGVLLAVQIALGGVTVLNELPPEVVAAHLGTAMAFLGVLIVTYIISMAHSRRSPVLAGAAESSFTRMALVAAAAAFVTLVLGSYISGTDAALACSGWPLCNGSLVPGGESAVGLHYLHRLLAGVLGLLLLGVAYLGWEERRPPALQLAVAGTIVAYIAQALIGAANIWTELAAGVVITHLSLAALLWCALVAISALAFYLRGAASPEREGSAGREAKVTEWAR